MSTTFEDLAGDLQRDLEERNRQLEEARLRAAEQMGYDENTARRVLNAAEFTGLPTEVVAADLENIESQIKSREFDVESYREQAPAWTQFLSENPYHMAALEQDTQNMGYIERSLHQIGLGWDATWAQVNMGLMSNQRIAQGGTLTPEQQAQYDEWAQLQVDHEFGAEGFVGFLVKNAKMLGPTLYSMKEGVEMGLGGAIVGGTSAAIAGQAGPQIAVPEEVVTVPAASLIGFKVGMATGASEAAFELERGFAYSEYRDMGIDHETALMASNTVGAVNAGLELVGIGKALKYIPGMRQTQEQIAKRLTGDVLTRPSMRRASATAVVRFGEVLGTEIVTEVMQESVTMVSGQLFAGDQYGLTFDMWADRVTETALETMQGAFLISSIGPGMSYYADLRAASNAEKFQNVISTLNTAASNSSTRENNRGAFQQFVQRLREQGGAEYLYVDGERFATYFQENNRDPEAVAADLGIDAKELQEARDIGGDIAIPTEQYVDKIAPTQAGFDLAADLKGSTEAMSAREANLWRKNNPEIVDIIESMSADVQDTQVNAAINQIVQDVQGQLIQAGYSQDAAEHLAKIMRGIGVLAERSGQDPQELYDRIFGGVRRIVPEAESLKGDVDVLIDPLLNRLRSGQIPSQREMFGPSLMDFINEIGGIDPADPELAAMDFELGAKDLGVSQAKLNRWKKEGGTLADIAERAAEQGYLVNRDENQLIEALRRELMGDPVYGSNDAGSAGMRDLSARLDELATMIDEAGLDLDNLTNEEVRTKLQERDMFLQIDTKELNDLTELVMQQMQLEERIRGEQKPYGPGEIDATIARAAAMLPEVSEQQDFGDLTFADTVRIQETGKRAQVKISAQREFDQAVKRKNVLRRLLDCVSG